MNKKWIQKLLLAVGLVSVLPVSAEKITKHNVDGYEEWYWEGSVTVMRGEAHTFWIRELTATTLIRDIEVWCDYTYKEDGETYEDTVFASESYERRNAYGGLDEYVLLTEADWENVSGTKNSLNFKVRVSGLDPSEGYSIDDVSFSFGHAEGDDEFVAKGPYEETVDGITWTYMLVGGEARLQTNLRWYNSSIVISRTTQGHIVIPSELGGCLVASIGEHAFDGCTGLVSATIPLSVTEIGCSAFDGCNHLTAIAVDAANPSYKSENGMLLTKDGRVLVRGVNKNVTIPPSVVEILSNAFEDYKGLTSIIIPSNVTDIGDSAFSGCDCLKDLTLSEGVTCIGNSAFFGCSGLKTVIIPSSATDIAWNAFEKCAGLTKIVVDTANPVYMSANGLLLTKDGLTLIRGVNGNVTIPDGVNSLNDGAFSGCSGLSSVSFPTSIVYIGCNAFYGCSGLTDVTIPSNVERLDAGTFDGCSGLKFVSIPASVTDIGSDAFSDCVGLIKITVDAANPNYMSEGGLLLTKDGSELLQGANGNVTIPNSVTSISRRAFYGCRGLVSVKISDGVKEIGDMAFSGCSGLKEVTIPSRVEIIRDRVFADCSGLTSVVIPEGVQELGTEAFSGCSGLKELQIPSSLANIGQDAFDGCGNLLAIEVNVANSKYASVNGMLVMKDGQVLIRGVRDENGCALIPKNVMEIGEYAFSGCSGLLSVTIPKGVWRIGECAFENCVRLISLSIPTSVLEIGDYAFYNCMSLTTLTIPKSVSGIGNGAFSMCSGLKTIMIREGVSSIGACAFCNCDGLTAITVPQSVEKVGKDALGSCEMLKNVDFAGAPPYGVEAMGIENNAVIRYSAEHEASWESVIANCGFINATAYEPDPDMLSDGGPYREVSDNIEWTFMVKDGEVILGFEDGLSSSVPLSAKGRISIPLELGGCPVTMIGDSAFSGCSGLESVTISDNVTRIGRYAFSGCTGLRAITIPAGVACIGEYAFYRCSGLTSLTISDGVKTIGDNAFQYCSGLPSVSIPSSVTEIGSFSFQYCSALKSVTIPSGVKEIGMNAFCDCDALSDVTIGWDVELIGSGAFANCKSLKAIAIPPRVTVMGGGVFAGCSALGSVSLPSGLTEIMASSFSGCKSLQKIELPSCVTNIGDYAFSGCKGLRSFEIPRGTQKVNGLAFCGCASLQRFDVAAGNTEFFTDDGVLFDTGRKTLVAFPGGKKGSYTVPTGVEKIGTGAFDQCGSVTKVELPESVSEIGDYAFSYCPNLSEFKVDSANRQFQSYDGVIFNADYSELIVFPCGRGGSYVIPDGVRCVHASAFNGSVLLQAVAMPSCVTEIGACAFNSCEKLSKLSLSSELTTVGANAFSSCKSLISLTLPSGMRKIGTCAFSYCSGLLRVTIPDSVSEIGQHAFYGCTVLKKICVEEGCEDSVRELLNDAGIDLQQVKFVVSGETPIFDLVVGMKSDVDVGLVGRSVSGLPKGLSYNSKTGHVMGTAKSKTGEYEVVFSKKGEDDETAVFAVREENKPTVACGGLDGTTLTLGVTGGSAGIPLDLGAESGVKSVTATKLPTGMKIASSKDKTSWYITGAPTKAGTYEVTITLTTAAGNKVTEKFSVAVAALPSGATGTFNGFVQKAGAGEGETLNAGSFQVTVSDVGKITAKVVAAAGTYSFTATGWDSVNEGVYSVKMTTKKGDVLTLACDSTAAWNAKQMTGAFTPVDAIVSIASAKERESSSDAFETNASTYAVEAQKNAFGKQWFFAASGDETSGWTLSFAENAKSAALTVTLNADGKTAIAGTLYGEPVTDGQKTTTPSYKVSASGYADVSGIASGAIFADFAPVISVKNGKTATKKALSLRANLWFDKNDDHEQGVGSAVFVP